MQFVGLTGQCRIWGDDVYALKERRGSHVGRG